MNNKQKPIYFPSICNQKSKIHNSLAFWRLRKWSCGALLLPLIFLAGCRTRSNDAESDEDSTRSSRASAAQNSNALRGLAASLLPLRRAADCLLTPDETDKALSLLLASSAPAIVFTAAKRSDGLLLRAFGARDDENQSERTMLTQLDFKADDGATAIWSRRLLNAERRAFENRLAESLKHITQQMSQIQNHLREAAQPGRLLQTPSKLVYTGHSLDIAFADAGADPHLFVAMEGKVCVRGGRVFIAEDGMPGIGNHKLAGLWRKAPRDAEQIYFRPDGQLLAIRHVGPVESLGRIEVVKLSRFQRVENVYASTDAGDVERIELQELDSPLRIGHLEFPALDCRATLQQLAQTLAARRAFNALIQAIEQASPLADREARANDLRGPFVIHADLPWSAEHFKALGLIVNRAPGRLTLVVENDSEVIVAAGLKVLLVLRQRIGIHEQNLRNAGQIRDENNRINPYRRKILKIGPQGEAVEGLDNAALQKTYKPGDPNADADGFILLPNVNRVVEIAELQAAVEEYKLVRAVIERLAPQQIFPDPSPASVKPEAP
ncbi:MAG: hypothetical protein V1899_05270 [Planctomycetota bacterium]